MYQVEATDQLLQSHRLNQNTDDLTSQSAEPGRLSCDTVQTTNVAGWFYCTV